MKFEEKKSEISELVNIRNIYDRTNKIESEKSIIRSRTIVSNSLRALKYEVSYYLSNGLNKIETYPHNPFETRILHKSRLDEYEDFTIKAIDDRKYELCFTFKDKQFFKVYEFGMDISLPGLTLNISDSRKKPDKNGTYILKIHNQDELFERINRSLKLDATQNISLLSLQFTDHNPTFATDFLNALIKEYLIFDRKQRSTAALQTSTFINSLLKTIADTVKKSGDAVQRFRQNNQSLIVADNLNLLKEHLAEFQAEKHSLDISQLLVSSLENSTAASDFKQNYSIQGSTDSHLNGLLIALNDLIIRKKRASDTYTDSSEIIKRFDREIKDLQHSVKDNIAAQRKYNGIKNAFLLKQIDSLNSNLSMVPKAEKELTTLQARSDIDQKVYSYLAEKKLEAEIAKSAVTSGAIIIDKAMQPRTAISPVPGNIYLSFSMLSILAAATIIYIYRLSNPYLYNKNTIEELSQTPIIGILRKCKTDALKRHAAITMDPRSLFSESLRSMRSNLSFFGSERNGKIICITSEISGEGKSFVSTNLAISLTLTDKRVLLIAADLRRSKMHEDFQVNNSLGLSKFLSGQASAEEILIETQIKNLSIIPSGPMPPNPSELLHNQKMKLLLDKLRQLYDLIILDSAPIGLVTDAKPLLKMADVSLFIVRSGISKRHFASTPDLLKEELGLENIAIVLNDYEENSFYSSYNPGKPYTATLGNYYHPNPGSYNYQNYFEL